MLHVQADCYVAVVVAFLNGLGGVKGFGFDVRGLLPVNPDKHGQCGYVAYRDPNGVSIIRRRYMAGVRAVRQYDCFKTSTASLICARSCSDREPLVMLYIGFSYV